MEKGFELLQKKAQPIFLEGLENEANIQAGFVCEMFLTKDELSKDSISGKYANVYVAARSFYRLYVNGIFCAHGPARAAEGFLRVDPIDVTDFLKEGKNTFAFEVSSYGDPFDGYSNDTVLGKGLLRAAVTAGEKEIYSSPKTFSGIRLTQRARLAERISHCRAMAENYTLDEDYCLWRTDKSLCGAKLCVVDDGSTLIERGTLLPTLEPKPVTRPVAAGRIVTDRSIPFRDSWFERPIGYYKDLGERPRRDYLQTVEEPLAPTDKCVFADTGEVSIRGEKGASYYVEYDLGSMELGFIDIAFETEGPGIVDIIHLESYCVYGFKDETGGGANPVTRLHVQGGSVSFTSMEPALGRYFKLYFRGCGSFRILRLAIRQYTVPDVRGCGFLCSDDNVNRLFNAAALTFRLNTLDIFMDCPERERGGWLCDSYWTGRAERMLLGGHRVEKDLLENFLMTDAGEMWRGFFPECYPGNKQNYKECAGITTWSFWLMEELCEYFKETGDREFIEKYRERIEAFVAGAMTLCGPTGILENLPWLFVDWSYSNDAAFNTPVSTAANALFSDMLTKLGRICGRGDWSAAGEKIRSILRNAILSCGTPGKGPALIPDAFNVDGGKLISKDLHTESCTYLTLWSGIIDREAAPLTVFNAVKAMGPCPEFNPNSRVGRAGLFIGLQYRFDMLAKLGEYGTLFRELNSFYGAQLREGPGTLWESPEIRATSYCHGFTSYAAVQLLRDVVGIGIPDAVNKTVTVAPHPCGLRWARGSVMTPDGLISVSWVNENGEPEAKISLPEGWKMA